MTDIYTTETIETLNEWYEELDRAFNEENPQWVQDFYENEVQTEGRVHINLNKYYNG